MKKKISIIMSTLILGGLMCITPANIAPANAEVNTRAATCCDRMRLSTSTKSKYVGSSRCTTHSNCTIYRTDYYKVKKCGNCGAVHSETYSYSDMEHIKY